MAESKIDLDGLPVAVPGEYDYLVGTQLGNARKWPLPEVNNAAMLLSATISDVLGQAETAMGALVSQAEADISAAVAGLGYLPPVAFESGLLVSSTRFTVERAGQVYAPLLGAIPFTTTATFNPAQWRLVQGVVGSDLSDENGSALVGFRQQGSGAVLRSLWSKERDIVSIRDFGASGTDFGTDTASIELAINLPSALVPSGKYRMVSKAASPYTFGNDAATPVYEAVRLKSNMEIAGGNGSILRPFGFSGQPTPNINASFGTGKPMTISLSNITFRNLTFDFDPVGNFGQNHRGPYVVGVNGLRYIDIKAVSTGARNGYFSHIQNCTNVLIDNFECSNVTGGLNFSYCHNIKMSNISFENFSEAIDFDRFNYDVQGTNWSFKNAPVNSQCIDLNDATRVEINGIHALSTGGIFTINYKNTAPDNFPDYVNNVTPTNLLPSSHITLRSIRGQDCGSATSPVATIGNDWSGIPHVGFGPVENIKIQDGHFQRIGQFLVRECRNLLLEDLRFDTVYAPVSGGTAALDLSSQTNNSDQMAWSDLSAIIRNVSITGSTRGGFRCSTPSYLKIDGLDVRNSNTSGSSVNDVDLVSLDARSAIVEIDGLVTPGIARIGGGGDSYSVRWGEGNRVGSLSFSGTGNLRTFGKRPVVAIHDIAATGSVERMLFTATKRCYVTFVEFTPLSAIPADAVNTRAVTIRAMKGGVDTSMTSYSFGGGVAAHQSVVIAPALNAASTLLNPGDTIRAVIASVGTGRAIPSCLFTLNVLEVG